MNEKVQENQARINMYGFLSRLLIEEVDVQLLDTIKSSPDLLDFFPTCKEWREFFSKDSKSLVEEELNVDYTTVFLLNVYPYESVFMNDEGYINPSLTNPALQFYLEHGYEIDLNKTRVLSPDHIAVEMEFMITLIQEQLNAYSMFNKEEERRYILTQKEFLENHLLKWSPIYLLSAKDTSETPFYKDVCQTTLEFLLSDYEYIDTQLQSLTV
ncbi:MAG: molecular chaperone TorD family protein [Hydrogenothermaceae bacterium]|nr:molecular chaperone TorD family protein [Hydrogenothermaceae bacterium]